VGNRVRLPYNVQGGRKLEACATLASQAVAARRGERLQPRLFCAAEPFDRFAERSDLILSVRRHCGRKGGRRRG